MQGGIIQSTQDISQEASQIVVLDKTRASVNRYTLYVDNDEHFGHTLSGDNTEYLGVRRDSMRRDEARLCNGALA